MLNFKHLHYFWTVAHEGSITRASERLHITPQTISGQLSMLEEYFGSPLFHRNGRNLQITDAGRMVLGYADEIFSLGNELEDMLKDLPQGRPQVFRVGVVDVVPKIVAYRLLAPALKGNAHLRLICREGPVDTLLAELALQKLDMVLAERTIPANINIRGFSHLLGESDTSFFATPALSARLNGTFPQNLDKAPILLPGEATVARGLTLRWFEKLRIRPRIIGEFDDGALMKAFGEAGTGVFISPTVIADEVVSRYGVKLLGSTAEIREQYYAISVDGRLPHPAVGAITSTARAWLPTEMSPSET